MGTRGQQSFGISSVRREMSVQARAQVHRLWTGGAIMKKMSRIECDAEVDIVAMMPPAGMKYADKLYVFFSLFRSLCYLIRLLQSSHQLSPQDSAPPPMYCYSRFLIPMFVSLDYVTYDLYWLAYNSAQSRIGRRRFLDATFLCCKRVGT
jgi:hypothetical protein